MYFYWNCILEPALTLRVPQGIVEIGSEDGKTTRLLLDFCKRQGATLQAIDPVPKFDADAWQQEAGARFVVHRSLSLDVIAQLDRFDVALIDGDHNWYTVYHELKLLEERSRQLAQPFPLVFMHDVGWPFGRRDGYYDLETIPPEFRQPCEGETSLPDVAGAPSPAAVLRTVWHAKDEGGARNGVLTAVEDFLREAPGLRLIVLPGLHGLAILFPAGGEGLNPELIRFLQTLELPPVLKQYVELVESVRVLLYLAWLTSVAQQAQPTAAAQVQVQDLVRAVSALGAK